MTGVPMNTWSHEDTETQGKCQGGGRDWMMHLQAKEGQELPASPEARRKVWKGFSLTACGTQPC